MNKNFGYSKKGGQDWFVSDAYTDMEIEAIKDPEGGSEISLPTAIPTPFARMDLVKTAFRNINKSPTLKAYSKNGNVVAGRDDEKLVSEALDLAEIMFNIDSVKDKIRIITWDRASAIAKLKNGSEMHRRLADALGLYLAQDAGSYNFDELRRLYLIEYDHKIIGCTSPVTLFFATANDLTHAQIKLTKKEVTFSENSTPLYLREPDFQRYLHHLFKANAVLAEKMKEVNEYLKKSEKILDKENHKLYNEINELTADTFTASYSELNTGLSGDVIEVIGIPLRKRKKDDIITSIQSSEFIIRSAKNKAALKPLVLQNNFNKAFKYINDTWDNAIPVPYIDYETVMERRWLPGVRIQYPYLTVSDFLEPYLIRLVYPINKDRFFDGNVVTEVGDDSKGYLLPLTKKFFDYYDSTDLLSALPAKPRIEMKQGAAGSVKVTLQIPVAKEGEYISFERTYYQSSDTQLNKTDIERNKGLIIEHQFGITVFPFIKTNNPEISAYYRVQLVDRDVAGILKNTEYDLKFFDNTSPDLLEIRAKKTRSKKRADALEPGSQYYVLNREFDYIQISNITSGGASGIIIPRWPDYNPGKEIFSFAVDFGTTNTHIEYKIGNGAPRPLDITVDDVQIATLFHPDRTTDDFGGTGAGAIRELINHEFVPQHLGPKSDFKFPHRTVIAESHSLNIETETFSLADFNIPFIYERIPEKDKVLSNLKWASNEKGNGKRIRAYFEKVIMLLRNKVLLNRGDLSQTKLVWFYPSSMKPGRKSSLANAWNELFKQYFNPAGSTIGITEALAPFYYFKSSNIIQGGAFKPVVSVDIGGGTTDIVVFKSNRPLLTTSFKFAGNTIFGDGFSRYGAANSNGIIRKYLPHYEELLATNWHYDLSKVLTSIKEKNKTEDINAFFFSIENNPTIKDKKLYSYNQLLSNDEDLKILFVYFYVSVVYQIAEVMKYKNIECPKHLVFSGTGSKMLNIITSDMKILGTLSKQIFEAVYGTPYDSDGLTIELEKEMPKEVTCKGGLMSDAEDLAMDIQGIKTTFTCMEHKGIDKLTYEQLDDNIKADIVTYVKDFNAFFFKLNRQYSFSDYFNVSEKSLEIFKEELSKHLRDYLEEGLEYNRHLDEMGAENKELEETLFFYPIIGAINNLSSQLSQLTPVNN